MSVCNPDDELIQEYLAESREHLQTIQGDLLAMEQAGAAIDEDLVNRVFRAAHSIKGGAGFFDLDKIKELAHKTENVLDLVRSRQLIPDSKVINILLLAFDMLRDLVLDFRESNNADISDFTRALTKLTVTDASAASNGAPPVPQIVSLLIPGSDRVVQIDGFDLNQARRSNKIIYRIALDLIHDLQQKGKTPLAVLRSLVNCGVTLETSLDLDSAGTLEDEPSNRLLLEIIYVTDLDLHAVSELLDISLGQILVVEDNGQPKPQTCAVPELPVHVPVAAVENEPVSLPAEPPTVHAAAGAAGEPAKPFVSSAPQAETTIRLNVALLDSLMNLAGELVLSRNQLNDAVANWDEAAVRASSHRLSMVASELQEAVSLTRMQPVMSLFSKFPRLVRDLSGQLGKEVQLKLDGGDVELDKTILEGLSDPLTHMVRNSVDHGIEASADRVKAGKAPFGVVTLAARHQAGQVVLEISDDGKGLSGEKIVASALAKGIITAEQAHSMSDYDKLALIFLPGFSTAEKITSVSGRGVGMDVVKTNLDRLGGKIEIHSVVGHGTSFSIKLPLTLAIIPSLLISDGGDRFAIPQVSVNELVRVPAQQIAERFDRAGDAEVIRVRDRLVPLVRLADALGNERRSQAGKAVNVVLVDGGSFEYGLVVEELHDTAEIVVKPMGRHLRGLREFAGATILGDGSVAAILDVTGLAARAGLTRSGATVKSAVQASATSTSGEVQSLLLFQNAPGESCALPIDLVTRVERIRTQQVENFGGRRTMQYEGKCLPLIALQDVAAVGELQASQQWVVIVFQRNSRHIGLLVAEPLDMVETAVSMDAITLRQTGVAGSAILNGRTTLMLNVAELTDSALKHWPQKMEAETEAASPLRKQGETVLLAEDSDFFRSQIKRLVEAVGYKVIAAEDGQVAWELLNQHADEIALVTTDVEMPRLDGLALTKRIRSDPRFSQLPIIALSALAGEEEVARGLAMGVSEYQVKLDPSQLLDSIGKAIHLRNPVAR